MTLWDKTKTRYTNNLNFSLNKIIRRVKIKLNLKQKYANTVISFSRLN